MKDSAFDLYSWNTPNGQKIVIALEETGAEYKLYPVDISNGEQHRPAFRQLSPDGKIPVLVNRQNPELSLFESGAILLYLADCFPVLHGRDEAEKANVMAWTFWQVGQLGPLAGQFGRFSGEETPNQLAIEHFEKLVWRCLDVLETRLEQSAYLAGDRFTVADVSSYPWIASPQSYLQRYEINWQERCPSLLRWAELIGQKSSVLKAFNCD